jgi:hypothetical protein
MPVTRPFGARDLLATIYHVLGINRLNRRLPQSRAFAASLAVARLLRSIGSRSGWGPRPAMGAVYGKRSGRWAVIGNQVLIDWADGSRNAIRKRGGKLVLVSFIRNGTTGVPIKRDKD